MKGSKCKCGFATTADRHNCPRCGKTMRPAAWPDEGFVLSFTRLQVIPEGLEDTYNLALVGIHKGPKVVCWASDILKDDQRVTITERGGKYFCSPWTPLDFKLDKEKPSPASMRGLSGTQKP